MDGFEQRLRHGLQDAARGVEPSGDLGSRVRSARRSQVRRQRAGRAGVGLAVAAAVTVGAVTLPGGSAPVGSGVAAAAELTAESSFRFETVVQADEVGATEVRAEGVVGAGAESARLVTTTPLPSMEGTGGSGPLEAVLDRGRLYVSVGAVVGPDVLPEGAEWLVLDLQGGGYADRLAASLLEEVGDLDPTRALDLLDEVTDGVVEDGAEEVRGEATTRYRFEARLDRGTDSTDGGEVGVPGRAWIDGDGRLRRLELAEAGTTATIELFDFGTEVDVDAPPRSDTVSLDRLVREGVGGLAGG